MKEKIHSFLHFFDIFTVNENWDIRMEIGMEDEIHWRDFLVLSFVLNLIFII